MKWRTVCSATVSSAFERKHLLAVLRFLGDCSVGVVNPGDSVTLVLTCEHGGHRVPAAAPPLEVSSRTLCSHRGWDPGALQLARAVARRCGAPLIATTVTRLLVDLNRSPDSPELFSPFSRHFDASQRRFVLDRYYFPYRRRVLATIETGSKRGRVLHLSFHSFTPVRSGERRETTVGLLFDPKRSWETAITNRLSDWISESLRTMRGGALIHFNRPYLGTGDGLTSSLRRAFRDDVYAGIEIEVNQKLVRKASWRMTLDRLALAITPVATGNPAAPPS